MALPATVFATGEEEPSHEIGTFLQQDQAAYVQKIQGLSDADPVVLAGRDDFNDFPLFEQDFSTVEHKSVGRAFVYSMAVPGLGEWYVGSKIKAALFFAFDVFSWYQYLSKHKSGSDSENEFEDFADIHWSPTKYTIWLVEEQGVTDDKELEGDHLPSEKSQQYYEMIGKYDKFSQGWDDADPVTGASSNRQAYLVMRDDANNDLDAARTWAMISLANHVLSGFDAALSAKRFNKKRDVFSDVNVKARLANYDGESIPQLVFTYKFY